jgi:hypothetical protein
MFKFFSSRNAIVSLLILALLNLSVCLGPAYASMIKTSVVLKQEIQTIDKKPLLSILERNEIQHQLESWGVDPGEAKARINALTDQEMAKLSQRIEEMPAGGSALGLLVGAGLFVFVVLLITDILGETDVFSFDR